MVCHERKGKRVSEVQIPVEFISVSERSRFNARRLIAALLVLLISFMGAGFLAMLSSPDDPGSPKIPILGVGSVILLLGGFIAFCVLLVSFFFRGRTVCLVLARHGGAIEFWRSPKDAQAIDALVQQIHQRQRAVAETPVSPVKGPTIQADPPSLTRRFLAYLWLSILPALFIRQPRLFLLAVFPITWFLVRQIQYLRQPAEYRRAVRCYRRKQWNEAVGLLAEFLDRYPDYLPAYVLLVHVFTRSGRFEDALEAIVRYGEDWPQISQELHNATWHLKRVGKRRCDDLPPEEQDESQLPGSQICE